MTLLSFSRVGAAGFVHRRRDGRASSVHEVARFHQVCAGSADEAGADTDDGDAHEQQSMPPQQEA